LSDDQIVSVLNASDTLLDQVSIDQHHDAVAGTSTLAVTYNYQWHLDLAVKASANKTKEQVAKALNQYAGLKADPAKIFKCEGYQNDTVNYCPVV
jgi:hypothetical protein